MSKITVEYSVIDFEKIDEEKVESLSIEEGIKYLKEHLIENHVEFPSNTETVDMHQEGVFEIKLDPLKNLPNSGQRF